MRQAWPALFLYMAFDAVQVIGAAVVRATGNQGKAAFITISAYWALGIPISALLGFKADWGLFGIWLGPTVSVAFTFVCYNILISKVDWPQLFKEVRERRANDQRKREELEAKAAAKKDDDF